MQAELKDQLLSCQNELNSARLLAEERQGLLNEAGHCSHRLKHELHKTRTAMEQKIAQLQQQIQSLQEDANRGVAEANRIVESERRRAKEALDALNGLLPEVECLNTNLEAERSRSGSLSAALSTTREMVKTLKQEASDFEECKNRLEARAASAEKHSLELEGKLSAAEHEAQASSNHIDQEMAAARN
eukprot:scaffold301252_cov38-Prasinocladus_malaysianus.AAC.1